MKSVYLLTVSLPPSLSWKFLESSLCPSVLNFHNDEVDPVVWIDFIHQAKKAPLRHKQECPVPWALHFWEPPPIFKPGPFPQDRTLPGQLRCPSYDYDLGMFMEPGIPGQIALTPLPGSCCQLL
jgi:hypothetical protein